MKKIFMLLFVFAIVMGIGTVAQASLFQDNLNPVRFFVVDEDNTSDVTLEILNINLSSSTLQYSSDQSTWNSITSSEVIFNLGSLDQQLVYWRLDKGSSVYDNVADVEFLGDSANNLWNGVTIFWDESSLSTEITFEVAADNDKLAAVPIPASALLLGSGIVGLIGFSKKRKK